jgi:hypothetical protein
MSKRTHVHLLVAATMGLGLVVLGLRPAGAAGRFTVGFAVVETTPTGIVYLAPSGRTLLVYAVPDASPTASSHPQVCEC